MISLRGKTALITGGSRGIGLAIARALALQGASTFLVGRNLDTLRSAQRSVVDTVASAPAGTFSCTHSIAQGDVSLPSTWQELVDRLTRPNGPASSRGAGVDILVNCAGVAQRGLLVRTSPADVDALLDANLKSAVLGCRYIGRLMMRSASSRHRPSSTSPAGVTGAGTGSDGKGTGAEAESEAVGGMSIINVSSVMASRGGYGASVYAASKAGILGKPAPPPFIHSFFSQFFQVFKSSRRHTGSSNAAWHSGLTSSLALEFGQVGIRVNALVPGYIKTDMTEGECCLGP